jgi:hypothetical protein
LVGIGLHKPVRRTQDDGLGIAGKKEKKQKKKEANLRYCTIHCLLPVREGHFVTIQYLTGDIHAVQGPRQRQDDLFYKDGLAWAGMYCTIPVYV